MNITKTVFPPFVKGVLICMVILILCATYVANISIEMKFLAIAFSFCLIAALVHERSRELSYLSLSIVGVSLLCCIYIS